MTKIAKKDFIEIEYEARLKEDNTVFDTTDEKIAKENGLGSEKSEYGPIIICVGEGQVLAGLDAALEGKDVGEHTVELAPEDAFGKKDAKLVQLIPTSKFRKDNIQPMPGMQINIDGMLAIIKTVSGGRTLVDFNHPISGRDVIYKIKVNKIITDDIEKIKSYLKVSLGIKIPKVEKKDSKIIVKVKQDIPKEMKKQLGDKIKELIGKDVDFEKEEEKKKEENTTSK